ENLAGGPLARGVRLVEVRFHASELLREVRGGRLALPPQIADRRTGHWATLLPGASRRSLLDPGSRVACALPPGNDLQLGQVETLPELRIVERHLNPERPEALNPLQLPELERLDVTSQIAEALQVFDVASVFQRFGGLGVDDGDLSGLGHALGGSVHDGLVDTLLDDLVPDVVGPVDVQPLLLGPETGRERGMAGEDE